MTRQPFSRYAALLLLVLPLAGTLACLNGSTPPPTWRFVVETREQLQGFGSTYAPNTPFTGDHLFDQPGAFGSQTRIVAVTNSLGRYYATDGRVPARWRFIWGGFGPCAGKFWEGTVPYHFEVELTCTLVAGSFFDDVGDGFLLDYVPDEYWDQASDLPQPPSPGGPDTLVAGDRLYPEESVFSADGEIELKYQSDGNLVIYRGSTPLWGSGTDNTTAGFATMQSDGNLVVYDGNGQPVWHSGTDGNSGAYLAVQDDGNIAIYSSGGPALWWSGSGGGTASVYTAG